MATADCCRIPVFQTLFHVIFQCFYLICPGFYRASGVLLLFWNHADGHWRTRRHSQWWRTCPHQGEASEHIFGSRRFFSAVAMTTCKSFDDLQIQQLSIVLELKVILDIFSTIQIYSTILVYYYENIGKMMEICKDLWLETLAHPSCSWTLRCIRLYNLFAKAGERAACITSIRVWSEKMILVFWLTRFDSNLNPFIRDVFPETLSSFVTTSGLLVVSHAWML